MRSSLPDCPVLPAAVMPDLFTCKQGGKQRQQPERHLLVPPLLSSFDSPVPTPQKCRCHDGERDSCRRLRSLTSSMSRRPRAAQPDPLPLPIPTPPPKQT